VAINYAVASDEGTRNLLVPGEEHKGWESVFSCKDGGNYAPALAASASTTAIFCSKSSGKPCRSCKYTGLLYESQVCP